MKNNGRRQLAILSTFGINNLQRNNPYMIAWWSAAFPGAGHYFLARNYRATLLTIIEVAINTVAHINEAIVYTFCGDFEKAKMVLQPRWALGYLIMYLYIIWDGYHTALVQNKMCHLAELENTRVDSFKLTSNEVQYLDRKNPVTGAFYSLFFPGLGQLYIHRFLLGFYVMAWWWVFLTLSRVHESFVILILGNIEKSIEILDAHWLLFMPSVLMAAIAHTFTVTEEQNRLFKIEQRQFLEERYQKSDVDIFN